MGAMMPEPRSGKRALRAKYTLNFRGGAVARHDLSPSELQAHVEKRYRWSDGARQAGNVGTALHNPGAAVRGHERVVTDGPYAESKDSVTGSLVIEAASLEDAVNVARTCPKYEFGRFRGGAAGPGPSDLTLVDERPAAGSSTELVEDLFRKEYAHLVSALTRVLGPSNIPLAEDVVHDALVSAMHAWRFGLPQDPKAWIIRAARNRAIDSDERPAVLRSHRRIVSRENRGHAADGDDQLVMVAIDMGKITIRIPHCPGTRRPPACHARWSRANSRSRPTMTGQSVLAAFEVRASCPTTSHGT